MVLIFQVWYPEFDALNNTKNRQWFVTHDDGCKRHNRYSVVLLKQKTNNKKQKKKNMQQQQTKTYDSPLNETNKNM